MKIIYKSLLLSLSILILGGFFAPLTHAQTNAGLVLEAQIIDYDDVLNIITARDAVFVEYEGRKLYADTLSYNQNTAMISVSGNVRIIEPTGEILTTNYAQLDDNLSEAVIEELLFQIDENARIAANGAIRTQGRYTAMAKAVYSACRACAENPDAPLLWQMKAADIVHDNVDKTIHYYDLSLEVKGVPIFYTPYFSHADPSVKYKTGLLFPTFGTLNSELFYMQPVYWNISAHEDATFTPIYANEQAMLGLEYRKQIKNGSLLLEGALSEAQNDVNKNDKDQSGPIGFASAKGELNFNPQWRSHFDVGATNDREFLGDNPLWPGLSSSLINNKVTLEGFNNHNYINASTLWYQELDTGDETDHPVILPELSYHGVSDADAIGGRFNYMAGLRQYGKSSIIESGQRLNLEGKYTLPLLLPKGIMTTSEVNLRGDLYHTDFTEEGLESSDHYKDGSAHRLVPRTHIDVRYPFMRQTDYGNQVAEPVMALFIAPNDAGNDKAIGNTDSSLFENDDSNLMSMDRIPGLDRIEEGSRLVVGGNFSHFFKDGKKIQAFAGQSFELAEDNVLDEELGVNASDDQIVGRVNLNLDDFGDYYYRFNLSSEDQSILKNELNFNLGSPSFKVSGGYSYVNKAISTRDDNYERVHGSLSSQLNDRWKASATSSFDMYEDRSISNTLGLTYEDECFIFTSNLSNKYYEDEQDEQAVMFSLTFKTVGSFQSAPISTRTEEE